MARKITDLQCWRLANELRIEVSAICAQEKVAGHRRFCDGFTEAAGSVCRNISEGFVRFESPQIVQFFTYAVASLAEVEDYLRECYIRKFIGQEWLDKDIAILEHARAKTLRFMQHHQRKLRRGKRRRDSDEGTRP